MGKQKIGKHINISYDFLSAPKYAKSIGCSIFQIFLGSPQQVISRARKEEELRQFGKELENNDIDMVIHGSYTINLCHPTGTIKFKNSVKSLSQDLKASDIIGQRCLGVIIHMGKNIPTNKISNEEALNNYVRGLQKALSETPTKTTIILETGASQGSEIASEIEGLAKIYSKLNSDEKRRVSFCIDTCHIWATGYNISKPMYVVNFFDKFDKQIGNEKIVCIHFNNSKTGLGSKVDRHADLGYGQIDTNGLKEVARFAKIFGIPLIMETPMDSINPKTMRDITFAEELHMVESWIKNKK